MRRVLASSLIALTVAAGSALAADTIKIGYIDPLSGGGASVGEIGLKHFQWLADQINANSDTLANAVTTNTPAAAQTAAGGGETTSSATN